MPARRGNPVLGAVMGALLALNTLIWVVPIYSLILLKLLTPWRGLRDRLGMAMSAMAAAWGAINVWCGDRILGIRWDIRIDAELRADAQYLIVANHQSWNDIYALLKTFGGRLPFFKFFLKQELIWVPFLGLAWWGLDYPFMKRYSRAQLQAHPELRGTDIETTRRACEKFANIPVAILNFVEGTRFTPAKRDATNSPYRNLLKPKAGGFAFTLGAMGEKLSALLDVTIVYPEGAQSFWAFLAGRVQNVIVEVRSRPLPAEFKSGSYQDDFAFRRLVQEWVGELWADKDRRIDQLLAESRG